MENKQKILNKLQEAINMTRAGDDVTGLIYDPADEVVNVYFDGEHGRTINVALDSGWAMIKDVIKQIDIG